MINKSFISKKKNYQSHTHSLDHFYVFKGHKLPPFLLIQVQHKLSRPQVLGMVPVVLAACDSTAPHPIRSSPPLVWSHGSPSIHLWAPVAKYASWLPLSVSRTRHSNSPQEKRTRGNGMEMVDGWRQLKVFEDFSEVSTFHKETQKWSNPNCSRHQK